MQSFASFATIYADQTLDFASIRLVQLDQIKIQRRKTFLVSEVKICQYATMSTESPQIPYIRSYPGE